MKAITSVLGIVASACVLAMIFSAYPQQFCSALVLAFILAAATTPVIGLASFCIVLERSRRNERIFPRINGKSLAFVVVLVSLTASLIHYSVPTRVAFALSRSSFEQRLIQCRFGKYHDAIHNERTGVYSIHQYEFDRRGGVYFCTNADHVFLDRRYQGFTHRPNSVGTPFGHTEYQLVHLDGDWYWFSVLDPW